MILGSFKKRYEDEDGYRTYHGKIVSYHIEPTPLGFECVFDVEVKELENIILQYHTDIFSSIESDFYKLCSSLDLMDTGSSMHLYMSVGRPVVVSIDKMWQGSYCIVAMDLDTERYDRD